MILGGIDEAGRGPVIGPMVMALVVIEEKDTQKLSDIGVKDSKLLAPHVRENLFVKIKSIVKDFKIVIVSPEEIDASLNSEDSNLNWLEARAAAKLINEIEPDRVILDCPSTNTESYTNYLREYIVNKKIELICEHKADVNYPVVAAASILAKVTRDHEIEKLKKKYKVDFGSGYPADPFTKQFLKDNYDKYPFFRKTWSTWKNAAMKKNQKSLFQF